MIRDVNGETVFEVTVRHNVVQSIRRVARSTELHVPATRLEVSSELAANHQRNGCIDGCYRFEDAEQARSFALLALDFVTRLLAAREREISALDSGADYDAGP